MVCKSLCSVFIYVLHPVPTSLELGLYSHPCEDMSVSPCDYYLVIMRKLSRNYGKISLL